jgi:hypothetical protein
LRRSLEHARMFANVGRLGKGFPNTTGSVQELVQNRQPVTSTFLRDEVLHLGG